MASDPMLPGKLVLRDCSLVRVLVCTMAMSRKIISSSKLIHKRVCEHHTCKNVIMMVIHIDPI
jgi:hypothetical protein